MSWNAVISCEMIGVYKTHRTSYETAARWVDLRHERIMLVSTHNNDIRAARSFGFRTAFLYRPGEWWDILSLDPEPSEAVEVVATDLVDLARQFGLSATGSSDVAGASRRSSPPRVPIGVTVGSSRTACGNMDPTGRLSTAGRSALSRAEDRRV